MALSLDSLPYDNNGGLTGKWLVKLRDGFSAHHAGIRWDKGISCEPLTGAQLRRFVAASGNVIGAVRVEGEPCRIGDVVGLVPVEVPAAVEAKPVVAPAPEPAKAAQPQHQQGKRK